MPHKYSKKRLELYRVTRSNLEFILDMLFGLNTGYPPKVHHQSMQMQRTDNFAALPVRGDWRWWGERISWFFWWCRCKNGWCRVCWLAMVVSAGYSSLLTNTLPSTVWPFPAEDCMAFSCWSFGVACPWALKLLPTSPQGHCPWPLIGLLHFQIGLDLSATPLAIQLTHFARTPILVIWADFLLCVILFSMISDQLLMLGRVSFLWDILLFV